jgi:hypothetical protein
VKAVSFVTYTHHSPSFRIWFTIIRDDPLRENGIGPSLTGYILYVLHIMNSVPWSRGKSLDLYSPRSIILVAMTPYRPAHDNFSFYQLFLSTNYASIKLYTA